MAAEDLGAAIQEKARSLLGEGARTALLGPSGEVLWSSMTEGETSLASRVARLFSGLWGEGDYYVGNLEDGCLVVMKATSRLCLALAAPARPGMLLFALRSMASSLSDGLRQVESTVMAQAREVELEVRPVVLLDVNEEREVTTVPPDCVPRLPKGLSPRVVRLDEKAVALLREADGKTVAELAEKLGLNLREACQLVARLMADGVLEASVRELVKPDYNTIFTIRRGVELEIALGKAQELGPAAVAVVANLNRGYSVLELSWGLRGLGLDIGPEELLALLKKLEEAGIVERAA